MAMSIDATPAVGARHVIRSINDPPQIAALKLTITTFGTDVFESSEEIKGALGAMNGAVFPSVQVPEPFLEAYRNAHHSETEISYAFNAYIFALRTMELMTNGEAFSSPESILAGYSRDEEGAAYRVRNSKDAGRYFEFHLILRRIVGERFELVLQPESFFTFRVGVPAIN